MSYVGVLLAFQGLISFIIATYSINGYLKLQSDTLKYFSMAFSLLSLGFLIAVVAQFVELGLWASYLINALHMFGYIFLAISHIISVRKEIAEESLPAMLVATAIMKSVGLYFLLYAAVETTIFSMKKGYKIALTSSMALYLIFLGEFIDLIMPASIPQTLPGLIRFIGFVLLLLPLLPVLKPLRGEGR